MLLALFLLINKIVEIIPQVLRSRYYDVNFLILILEKFSNLPKVTSITSDRVQAQVSELTATWRVLEDCPGWAEVVASLAG